MRRVRPLGLTAALLTALSAESGAAAASVDVAVVSCKAMDEAGGSNQLVFELRDDRIHAFRYRRNVGAPRCEIEASRSPSAYPHELSEWVDGEDWLEIRLYTDDIEDAHVRITRRNRLIELRVIGYDRWWHCGAGQALKPVIALRRGADTCILGP